MKMKRKLFKTKTSLIDSTLFKVENGKLVPTNEYLLKLGKCCKDNCKYCPYENNNS